MIKGDPKFREGEKRNDLVEHIDIAALSLAIAGIAFLKKWKAKIFSHLNTNRKKFVFAARDRCGEAADQIRSVRSGKFLYIKNFFPGKTPPHAQNYKDTKLIIKRLGQLHGESN